MAEHHGHDRTPITLEVLDPSPVDESPPETIKDAGYFPSQARSPAGLGLSSHGLPYYRASLTPMFSYQD